MLRYTDFHYQFFRYGDIAPVCVPGRLFAVVWILTGLVIIAIFTGVITTSLTVIAMSADVKLYGATVRLNLMEFIARE